MAKRQLTTEEFIEKAIKIHGNKYDYSKVNYAGTEEKVCIICPKHGEFNITPHHHLRGIGCPKCSGRYKTTEEWINEAKCIHGSKYDYSKSEYINSIENIKRDNIKKEKCKENKVEILYVNKNNFENVINKWLGVNSLI